jgi:hypothetical protein
MQVSYRGEASSKSSKIFVHHHAVFCILYIVSFFHFFFKREGHLRVLFVGHYAVFSPIFFIFFSFGGKAGQAGGLPRAPMALTLFFIFFWSEGKLDKLEGFVSHHGADFYKLPRNTGKVLLTKEPWTLVLAFFT